MTCMAYSECGRPPLHLLEDGHQGTPLAAVFLGQADQLFAETFTFGDKHASVSPIDMRPSGAASGPVSIVCRINYNRYK